MPRGMREKGREGRQERAGENIGRKEGRGRDGGEEKEQQNGGGMVKKAKHSTRNERIGKEMKANMKMGKMLIVFRLIPNLVKVGDKFLKVTWKLSGFWEEFFEGGRDG